MRSSLVAVATVVALGLSGCGKPGPSSTESSREPLRDLVYLQEGLDVQWCDRMDFKRLAVLPGRLVDGRPSSSVSPDGVLCSRAVLDADPAMAPIIVLHVLVFATSEQAKSQHETNSGTNGKPVSMGLEIDDAKYVVHDRGLSLLVLDRNLRITLGVHADPQVISTHAKAWEAAMPEFVADVVRILREAARIER